MSRITDYERGARMALDIAHVKVMQRDFFQTDAEEAIWTGIYHAADEALDDCDALKAARA